MAKSTADVVLHPVRLRILQALLGGRELTAQQLSAEIDGVSTATVYRQLATMVDAGLLQVVKEHRIRGAVERTYGLAANPREVTAADLAAMTPTEHKQAFAAFVASLLASFDHYIDQGDVDLVRDGVSYRHNALWLSDAELQELLQKTRELYLPYAVLGPGEGRMRRLMSTVTILDRDSAQNP